MRAVRESLDLFESATDCFWQGLATTMRATTRDETIGSDAGHQNACARIFKFLDPLRHTVPQQPPSGNQAHDHFVAIPIFQSATLRSYHRSENSVVATPYSTARQSRTF
jgi:hypothetical protein